ncbi:hypothetical protein COB52_01415 [Candidatus Kaiserbacteria bacterium]|nr:MAG: hypothetical protein COB52_01415 [Candidatus Kaiserbacteria bacterium]
MLRPNLSVLPKHGPLDVIQAFGEDAESSAKAAADYYYMPRSAEQIKTNEDRITEAITAHSKTGEFPEWLYEALKYKLRSEMNR